MTEMRKMPEESVDLIFADPPYWMRTSGKLKRVEGTEFDGCHDEWDNAFSSYEDYVRFTHEWLGEARRVLKPDGSIWVIGSMQCIHTIGAALQDLGFWLVNEVVWWKTNPTPNMMGTRLCNAHETLIWAVKSERARFTFHYKTAKELNTDTVSPDDFLKGVRKQMGSVWRMPVCSGSERIKTDDGRKLHSTQKPYSLLYRLINISSNPGDTVLDPFGGTFTTGEAALNSGRFFIGIEQDKTYCEYGARRLSWCVPELGDIETARADVKPPKVSWRDMVSKGALTVGERLFTKDGMASVCLLKDGKVRMDDGRVCSIHEAGAIIRGGKAERVNGFDVWYVSRGEELVSINEIREEYRKTSCEQQTQWTA